MWVIILWWPAHAPPALWPVVWRPGRGSGDREARPMWGRWGSTAFPVGSSRYAQLMFWMTAPHHIVQLPCWLCGTSSILITCATTSSSLCILPRTVAHLPTLVCASCQGSCQILLTILWCSRRIGQTQCGCSTSSLKWKSVLYSLPVSRRKIWSCKKMYTYLYTST